MNKLKQFLKNNKLLYKYLKRLKNMLLKKNTTYPHLAGNEIEMLTEVLKSPYWNMNYGKDLMHNRLEEEFAAYTGNRFAVAVNTGGMAIQIVLRGLGLKPGDEVIHQIDTCVANAFAINNAFVNPVFADISKDTFMLSKESIENEITADTKAIMPVHIWGNMEDMNMIQQIADKNKLLIIEDACLALGAEHQGIKAGSRGIASIFSFGCLKPIQAGEGGMITTNDESLAREFRVLRSWGETYAEYGVRDQRQLAWNGRMSEVVAAVALEQLRAYPLRLQEIRKNLEHFKIFLNSVEGITMTDIAPDVLPAYNQIVLKIHTDVFKYKKNDFMDSLRTHHIGVWHANFEPINSLSYYTSGNWKNWILKGDLNRLEKNYNQKFLNAEFVYNHSGLGINKSHFTSMKNVEKLIENFKLALKK